MGLYRAVSETNGDFSRKSQNFHPVYFAPPLMEFPLELGIGVRSQKIESWATGRRKKCDDFLSRLE